MTSVGNQHAEEIEALKKIVVDGIITTNWDTLLEELFPGFKSYIGQDELLFSQPQSIAEIYKIHGCCTSPNSLVLTDEDYSSFLDRNAYLAARLLTIFVDHPVIFLGYSLSDEHVQNILKSIVDCLTTSKISKLTNNLIFVEWDEHNEGDVLLPQVHSFGDKRLPLTFVRARNYTPIYHALSEKKRAIPARLLRQLKEQIYDLVRTNDPSEKMRVEDFNGDVDASNIEVVFGIGIVKNADDGEIGDMGYGGIDKDAIFKDVIKNNGEKSLNVQKVLEISLPVALKTSPSFPVFKYLRSASMISADGKISSKDVDIRIQDAFKRNGADWKSPNASNKYKEAALKKKTITELLKDHSPKEVVQVLLQMKPDDLSLDELQEFLRQNICLLQEDGISSTFRKLICRYDYLRYGR